MSGPSKTTRSSKAAKLEIEREGVLANRIRAGGGPFNAASLSRSYALPVERVREIITRNGGSHAQ